MKYISFFAVCILVTSCQSINSPEQILSQSYVHKYGFPITEEEWDQRSREGQVIAHLKNGVTVTRTYENGVLHGPTMFTFPKSSTVERILLYDQGNLLKETMQDEHGIPIREEAYEFDDRLILTFWNDKGVPLSIEEYKGEYLIDGKYFSSEHELESRVENSVGVRNKRDRSGLLISCDKIENGVMTSRTTYHPNGQMHTVSNYNDYVLHGEQVKYTSLGRPLMSLQWKNGILDGTKTVYRNGLKVAEIPYVDGEKEGLEYHFDDLGNLIAEIPWRSDQKHGCAKFYTEDSQENQWFFDNALVTRDKFLVLQETERIVALFQQEQTTIMENERAE